MSESEDVLPGQKERIIKTAQVRIDKVMRQALSSKMVETALLEGRIWRNDSKVIKKAHEVQVGDILDLEIGPDPKNPNLLKVHRVEVTEIKVGESHNYVRVLISRNLTIPPYDS